MEKADNRPLLWLRALGYAPEFALFVFLAVCFFMVIRKGGPYYFLIFTLPILISTVLGVKKLIGRRS